MQKYPMLDLPREYRSIRDEIDEALKRCLMHQQWILGPEVTMLEDNISQYLGNKYCVGVSSGTEALVLALRALAITRKGTEYFDRSDEIVTTSFTFTATGDAILRAGATPVFVDIDPITFNIDSNKVEEYLTKSKNVVGILPVHLYGLPCYMERLRQVASEFGLFLLEDVAQAFGAAWSNRKVGTFGELGCFSFFPSKNLGCFGDGGMISTDDQALADTVRMLMHHGGKDKYNATHIGYNARLDTLQAAVLLVKLRYVNEWNMRRRQIADKYNILLARLPDIELPTCDDRAYHVYNQYTVRLNARIRDSFQQVLRRNGVDSMVYYPVPLHHMAIFDGRCVLGDPLINTTAATGSVLSLPIEPLMDSAEIEAVASIVRLALDTAV